MARATPISLGFIIAPYYSPPKLGVGVVASNPFTEPVVYLTGSQRKKGKGSVSKGLPQRKCSEAGMRKRQEDVF